MAQVKLLSRRSLPAHLIAVAMVCSASSQATAQPTSLTPVEQSVADVSPLSASLRQLEPDFSVPQRFDRVYTSPDFPGMYLRINGALTAVFPQSEYVQSGDGMTPILPRNTEYFIGRPSRLTPFTPGVGAQIRSALQPPLRDLRQTRRAPSLRYDSSDAPPPPTRHYSFTPGDRTPILRSSEQRRRIRVAHWLALAAAANPH